jgi:hypothetical protein
MCDNGKITQGSQTVFVAPREGVEGVASPIKLPVVAVKSTCNNTPTPAPEAILGKCEYYQFRYDDFV